MTSSDWSPAELLKLIVDQFRQGLCALGREPLDCGVDHVLAGGCRHAVLLALLHEVVDRLRHVLRIHLGRR
jgi:hypothetical protein